MPEKRLHFPSPGEQILPHPCHLTRAPTIAHTHVLLMEGASTVVLAMNIPYRPFPVTTGRRSAWSRTQRISVRPSVYSLVEPPPLMCPDKKRWTQYLRAKRGRRLPQCLPVPSGSSFSSGSRRGRARLRRLDARDPLGFGKPWPVKPDGQTHCAPAGKMEPNHLNMGKGALSGLERTHGAYHPWRGHVSTVLSRLPVVPCQPITYCISYFLAGPHGCPRRLFPGAVPANQETLGIVTSCNPSPTARWKEVGTSRAVCPGQEDRAGHKRVPGGTTKFS